MGSAPCSGGGGSEFESRSPHHDHSGVWFESLSSPVVTSLHREVETLFEMSLGGDQSLGVDFNIQSPTCQIWPIGKLELGRGDGWVELYREHGQAVVLAA